MDKRCLIAREALDWLLLSIPEGESKYSTHRPILKYARVHLTAMIKALREEEHEELSRTLSPCPCGTCDFEKREERRIEDIAIRSIIHDDESANEVVVEENEEGVAVGTSAAAGAGAEELKLHRASNVVVEA
jgi:hypothetical protein